MADPSDLIRYVAESMFFEESEEESLDPEAWFAKLPQAEQAVWFGRASSAIEAVKNYLGDNNVWTSS